jgi:anti-sigma regulatory factor (Ser/Thr protein kinase)
VAVARRGAARLAEQLGFGSERAAQAALVTTELATNVIKHAGGGEMLLTECRAGSRVGLEILTADRGRGFRNLEEAFRDGTSTAGTLGNGLGAVRRQSDLFEVFSQHSKGSTVLARLWRTPTTATDEAFAFGAVCLAKPGEESCGDAWAVAVARQQASLILADGLGHGLAAAEASGVAVAEFTRAPWDPPVAMLENVHLALRSTRGAAVTVAGLDLERSLVRVAGLGNVSGAIVTDGVRRNVISMNGTAGHAARRVQEFSYPLSAHSTFVLHSDGLGTHWDPAGYPDLWSHDPSLVAGVLYRDFTRRRDDVTIVVGRGRLP